MMRRLFLLFVPALLLTGCQTVIPASEEANGAAYRALGTEPFWSLRIEPDRMVFERAGEPPISARGYQARPSFNGWRYSSQRITVDVTHSPCSDGMSDRVYKDSVMLRVDNQDYRGCGGGVRPPAELAGTNWRIVSIGGTPVEPGREAGIGFDATRMSGSAGCNRLGADYRRAGDRLSFGPMMATRMACPAPLDRQEAAFSELVAGGVTLSFDSEGRMLWRGASGTTAVLEQAI